MASFVWSALVGAAFKTNQGFTNIPAALVLGIGARLVAKFTPATFKAVFGFIFLHVSLKYILLSFGIRI